MKCYKCGAEVDYESKFCSKCGSPQGFSEGLIADAKKGKQEAITELYNRTYNNVYQSVRMLVKDDDTALDIVQDAYIRGFQHLEQLDEPNHFRAWMKRIGINTAKNYLKKKQPILFSEMESSEEDDSPELQFVDERQENLPEVSIDKKETTRLINEILNDLSEEQRLVVTLYFYEEMNAREIADELGVSEDTIRSRLRYAKKKIETKVLEIEKRDGIRLHSLAPIPFLLLLFRSQKAYAMELPNGAVLQGVQSATAKVAGSAGKAVGTKTVTKTAGKIGKKVASETAKKAIAGKVVAGFVVVSVAFGGGAYVVHQHNTSDPKVVQTEAVSDTEEKDSVAQEQAEQRETEQRETEQTNTVDMEKLNTVLQEYASAVEQKDYYAYAFIYVDDDDIPELLAEGKSTREGSDIYYLGSDNEAHFIPMDFGQVCIAERKGFLDNHWNFQNTEGHKVYQLEQGEIEELGEDGSSFPYKEKECVRYTLGKCTDTVFEDACKNQLGITFEIDETESDTVGNGSDEDLIDAVITLHVSKKGIELQEGDTFTMTYQTDVTETVGTVELDAYNGEYQEYYIKVPRNAPVQNMTVLDLKYNGNNPAILNGVYGCQAVGVASAKAGSHFTLLLGEDAVSEHNKHKQVPAFVPKK